MKSFSLLIVIFILIVIATGCDQPRDPISTGRSVKIGVIGPMSGPDKAWGESGLSGVRTALKLQPFLYNGSEVTIVVEDDQNQPELARKALLKLSGDDSISSIIILSSSEVLLALVEIADDLAIPILAAMSTHPDITKDNSYISQLLFDDYFQASVAASYIRDELLANRVGVMIDEKNPHSEYLARQFIAKFESTGGSCRQFSVNKGTENLRANLKSIQYQELNFIYMPLDAEYVVSIAQMFQEIDYHPVMLGSDGLQATILLQYADKLDLVEGMLATDPFSSTLSPTEYGKKISHHFRKSFSTPGTVLAAQSAEGTSIMLSAINRCSEQNDRSCINSKLRSTRDFTGMFGKISIGIDGKAERPIFINTIEGDMLRGVVKVY